MINRKNKYNAVKTTYFGHKFDSKAEGARYLVLRSMLERGTIQELELQPKFILQEKFTNNQGQKIRAITYKADFKYIRNGQEIVEDVKGKRTRDYIIRSKLFQKRYPEYIFRETK